MTAEHKSDELAKKPTESKEGEGILGTTIQWDWVENALTKALKTNAKFGSNKCVSRIGAGQGFISLMGRITTDWTEKSSDLPETVVIKLPTSMHMKELSSDSKFEQQMEHVEGFSQEEMIEIMEKLAIAAHNAEVGFYRMVQKNNLKLRIPKCYVMKEFSEEFDQGVIIMEDLGVESFTVPAFKSISPRELIQIFDTLTDAHAFSLKNDDWRSIKMIKMSEQLDAKNSNEAMLAFIKMVTEVDEEKTAPLMKKLEEEFDKIHDLKIFDNICDEIGISPVLAHGDLWSSNVLWKKEGSLNKLVAIVDWQLIHPGCAAEDLARIMCSALTTKDRRENWESLIETYYEMLTSKLGEQPPFSLAKTKKSYQRIFPLEGIMIMPIFGPVMKQYAIHNNVEDGAVMTEMIKEKVVGLLEDIIYYHQLNENEKRSQ